MPNRLLRDRFNRIKYRIEEIMQSPVQKHRPSFLETGLRGTAFIYGHVSALRRRWYRKKAFASKRLPAYVISVGNLAVGGTGKTPMTIYLAKRLQQLKYRPAIISRGYGGSAEKSGCVVSDGNTILAGSSEAGDEPVMMAKALDQVPVIVGRNRYRSGNLAIKNFGCNVIILDDGFQHIKLSRDLNILLLDAKNPLGNGYVMPRGILRETCPSISDADVVVFTRSHGKEGHISPHLATYTKEIPCFWSGQTAYLLKTQHTAAPDMPLTLNDLNGKRVYLFSAIARNQDFYRTIQAIGANIQGHSTFSDHHFYTPKELKQIIALAVQSKSELLITTEKDLARLENPPTWPLPFIAVGVKIVFSTKSFDQFVAQSIEPENALLRF